MGRGQGWGLSTCDCGAAHGRDGRVMHPALRVLQGLSEGAGVRELVHPCELHLSEGTWVCLQCARDLSLSRFGVQPLVEFGLSAGLIETDAHPGVCGGRTVYRQVRSQFNLLRSGGVDFV